MSAVIPSHRPTTRRALLRALAAGGAVAVLAGCDETERRPPAPTSTVVRDDPETWPADSDLLLAARERVHEALIELGHVQGGRNRVARIQPLWTVQRERLEQVLSLGGVPLPTLAGSPTDRQGRDEAAATTAPAAREIDQIDLGRLLRAALPETIADLAEATPTNLPMLTSLAAQHADAATQFGASPSWEPLVGPEGAAAVPLLAVTRPAIFGLEVVAARSREDERAEYELVLDQIRSLTRQLTTLAGDTAPVPPLGYDLPEPLETEGQRRSLARALVADIAPAALGATERVRGNADQLTGIVRVMAESVLWARTLGSQETPFPGMTLP
ncbi:hypothetical protein ACQBAT_09865 [Ornithinimicrobium sp. Y1847]|uniref:hypothetical protein n=1 Tax=Ornithinimicrobium sp. Y1847 TaxID=3405419 RepID=UPI003B67CED4